MQATSPVLQVRFRDSIAVLTLDRPDRLNAVTLEMYESIQEAFSGIERRADIRAVVITGAGRAFCVGADLKNHAGAKMDDGARRRYIRAGQRTCRLIQNSRKPVVAAVNGHAIGAGLELALSCDFIVVSEAAKLRFPEIALGTFVGGGVTYTLPRRVGLTRARELIFLGSFFVGREALEMGIANRCVSPDRVFEAACSLARSLAQKAPLSLGFAKKLLSQAQHIDPETALNLEEEALFRCMKTRDWEEGIAAFAEKREPRFKGE